MLKSAIKNISNKIISINYYSEQNTPEEGNIVYKFLCINYVIFYMALFLTNEYFLAYKIFLFAIAPLSLIPLYVGFYPTENGSHKIFCKVSYVNPIRTFMVIKSNIFILASVYGLAITISSAIHPSFSYIWFIDIFKYLISILIFLSISYRISNSSPQSMEILCAVLCLIVSTNATINIFFYVLDLPSLDDWTKIRFFPRFGQSPDHYPTTSALTYAIFFSISSSILIQNKSYITRTITTIICIILLTVIILSQSRGPLIAILITLAIVSFFSSPKVRNSLLLINGLVLSIYCLLPTISTAAFQRGDNNRIDNWYKFLLLAIPRPIMGYGERIEFQVDLQNGQIVGHAHNIFISALIRGGTPACLSFIIIAILCLKYSLIFLKQTSNLIPFSAVLVLLVSGLVDFDLLIFLADWQWPSIWLVIALNITAEKRAKQQTNLYYYD